VQALAGPPPSVRFVLPGLTGQLPVSRGPVPRARLAVLQRVPGAVRTVRHPVAPLAGDRRRRRQGEGLQFLVVQRQVQKRSGEQLGGGQGDEIVHHRGV